MGGHSSVVTGAPLGVSGASRADPSGTRGRVPPPCWPCTVELQAQSLEPSQSPRRVPGTVPRWPLWAEGGRLAGREHSRTSKQVLTPVRVVCGARRCCSGHSAASAALRPAPPPSPHSPSRPSPQGAQSGSAQRSGLAPLAALYFMLVLWNSPTNERAVRPQAPGPAGSACGLCFARPGSRPGQPWAGAQVSVAALPCPWPSSVLEAWGAHSPPQPLTCGPRCPTRDRGLGAPCALLTRGPDPPGALTPQALSGCTPGGRGARCLRVWVLPPRERGLHCGDRAGQSRPRGRTVQVSWEAGPWGVRSHPTTPERSQLKAALPSGVRRGSACVFDLFSGSGAMLGFR